MTQECAFGDCAEEFAKTGVEKAIVLLAKKHFGAILWTIALIALLLLLALVMMNFAIGGIVNSFGINEGFRSGAPTTLATTEIGEYMTIFEQAQERYGVSWAVLAAIAKHETDFGKNMGPSFAGAVGFMQFMPTTWSGSRNPKASDNPANPSWDTDPQTIAQYGGFGTDGDGDGNADPFNAWDAVFAAANMLAKNGFAKDPRKAIYTYNHDWGYVDWVLSKAEEYSNQMAPTEDGVWPLPPQYTEITCPYGSPREDSGFHHGVDIACPVGTPVFAALPGRVTYTGWKGPYGNCIIVDSGSGTEILCAHLSQIGVRVGQELGQNQQIALSGNTGKTTGPHLHFEMRVNGRACDPMQWLKPPSKNY